MKIEMSNKIYLFPESDIEKDEIRRICSENLTFIDQTKLTTFLKFESREKIVCYFYDKINNCFEIPIGRYRLLDTLSLNQNIKITNFLDKRNIGIDADIKCKFNFRDSIQENAFNAYINNPAKIGMINLACGLGE